MALASVCSKTVILLLFYLLFVVASILCGDQYSISVLFSSTLFPF